jgi:hypothetical protein
MLPDVDPHRLAEERSLAYHRAVLERLQREPAILERARSRVAAMLVEGRSVHDARAWQELLSGEPGRLREVMVADTEASRALRQSTPFAGVLSPRERWRIWRAVRAQRTSE